MSPHCNKNVLWSKLCHVETFLHIINEETNLFCCFVAKSAIYAVLPRNLFCRDLCGEKFIEKLCLWRKKDKYEVWSMNHDIHGGWKSGKSLPTRIHVKISDISFEEPSPFPLSYSSL